MIEDKLRLNGRIKVQAINAETGEIVKEVEKSNLVVTLGLELTSKNWITGFTQDVVNNMAIGSGKRETSLSDTDLEYEEYRKGIDGSSVTKPSPSETLVEARIAPGVPDSQPFEIREIGWFTGTSDDSDAFMFSRIDLQDNPVPKDDDTEVRVIYQVGFKNV